MCLKSITKKYETPDPLERDAWKIFEIRTEKGLWHQKKITTPYMGTLIELDKWLEAEQAECFYYPNWDNQTYKSGFHCFSTEDAALKAIGLSGWPIRSSKGIKTGNWFTVVVVKIRIKDVTYEGFDGTGDDFLPYDIPNIVANKMYIASEEIARAEQERKI